MIVLFLDIDGVLNKREFNPEARSSNFVPECVENLNRVLRAVPDCVIVLSSAWRYLVSGGAMTLAGFNCLLRTHGVKDTPVVGLTRNDDQLEDPKGRGRQILEWVSSNPGVKKFVAVDDLDIAVEGLPFIMTDGDSGMTVENSNKLIAILKDMS